MKNKYFMLFILLFLFSIPILSQQRESFVGSTKTVIRVISLKQNLLPKSGLRHPDSGMKYIAVLLLIDNSQNKSSFHINPWHFILKDDEGYVYDVDKGIEDNAIFSPELQDEEIDSGDSSKGWIGFEVPANVSFKQLKLRYIDRFVEDENKSDWIQLFVQNKNK